jgi:hypothetical protein
MIRFRSLPPSRQATIGPVKKGGGKKEKSVVRLWRTPKESKDKVNLTPIGHTMVHI